ncbi:carbohydrate ABC transporter permease [Roseomonas sp. AR75]|uniref:carbohydrate ABC transporter permease n=1 Tax=Roseomonas sp. AR75 TaxID=2562311 RepID=UPI001981854D|nr:sugar ABC transporter permease [Roseomonas sp. AR75]
MSGAAQALAAPRERAQAHGGATRARNRFYALCVAPSLAVLAVITLAPALYLLVTSFTPLDLTRPDTAWNFAKPFENYRQMPADSRLVNSLWVQAKLSFWTVALQLVIGFGFALLLNMRSRFLEALRTVFLIPMVLPPIVVAIIWKVLYTPDISPLHWGTTLLGFTVPALITDPDWALTAIIIADTWQWFPFTMLMTLAALQMMPQEMVDAAKVDGASAWQMTWHVTLPFLKGVLLVAGLFRLIDSIKAFPLIFILTEGGPGSVTEVTNYYSFLQAFNFSFLGYSSAITVVLLSVTVLLSWAVIRAVGWGEHGE